MKIQPADIQAVRAVLTGSVTPLQAATSHTTLQHVLLAHTALAAGGFTRAAWKGQFGELLSELTLSPIVPADGWPHDHEGRLADSHIELFQWYCTQQSRLLPLSRHLGLHDADRAGNHLQVRPSPELLDLLRNPTCRQAALHLFQAAMARVEAKRAAEQDYLERVRRFKAAAAADPVVGHLFQYPLTLYTSHPQGWAEIYQALGKLLRQHVPEHLSD